MSGIDLITIAEADLSTAWLQTLEAVRASTDGYQFHTVTRIADPTHEDRRIRSAADALLADLGRDSIETVANTIFPAGMAASSSTPQALVDRYRAALPSLRRLHHDNQRGTYFGRIVAYEGVTGEVDQLGNLIAKLRGEQANTAPKTARYEVGIDQSSDDDTEATPEVIDDVAPVYTPGRDNAIMGFPCLSLCSFQLGSDRLHLVAHYRSQRLVQRGYGNYLGLARLLEYVARQANLTSGELMIVAGRADADIRKRRLNALLKSLS